MKVKVKLFAMLDRYLPRGASDNEAEIEIPDGGTAEDVMSSLNLPPEMCHLVLVNGSYLTADERGSRALTSTDVLAIWPPIAGG